MIYLLTLVIAATRFLPHPPNFACLGALGLFAGCYVAGRKAWMLPLAALLVSDIVGQVMGTAGMGFYNPIVMLATYLGVGLAVPLGRWLRTSGMSGHVRWTRLPVAAVLASTLFFLVSNFGVWMGPWYPATFNGLAACYRNAIPFFGYSLAGDLVFSAVIFGMFEISHLSFRQQQPSPAYAVCRVDR